MDIFINELKNREEVLDFIKSNVEAEAKALYTKTYNVDFFFEDLLQNRINEVIVHFKDRIDENQIREISKELNELNIFKGQNQLYVNNNRLDLLLEK